MSLHAYMKLSIHQDLGNMFDLNYTCTTFIFREATHNTMQYGALHDVIHILPVVYLPFQKMNNMQGGIGG